MWNPLRYLDERELERVDQQLDAVLCHRGTLVFWTGLNPLLAHSWAASYGLTTMTMAMGDLYAGRDSVSPKSGKNKQAWSKYIKGASGRFAEYACRGRQAIILTNPPPDVYAKRPNSTFRLIEEPILMGAYGGSCTDRIFYAHPKVAGAEAFIYQVWPVDDRSRWESFSEQLASPSVSRCLGLSSQIDYNTSNQNRHTAIVTAAEAALVRRDRKLGGLEHFEQIVKRLWARLTLPAPASEPGRERETKHQREDTLEDAARHEREARCQTHQTLQRAQAEASRRKREAKRHFKEAQEETARLKREANRQRQQAQKEAAHLKRKTKRQRQEAQQKAQAQASRKKRETKCQNQKALEEAARQRREAKRQKQQVQEEAARQRREARRRKHQAQVEAARQRREAKRQKHEAQLRAQEAAKKKEVKIPHRVPSATA